MVILILHGRSKDQVLILLLLLLLLLLILVILLEPLLLLLLFFILVRRRQGFVIMRVRSLLVLRGRRHSGNFRFLKLLSDPAPTTFFVA